MFRSKSFLALDNSAFVTGSESAAKLFVENKRTEDTAKAGRQAGRQMMCQKLVSYNVLILFFPSLIQIQLGTFANQRSTILYK